VGIPKVPTHELSEAGKWEPDEEVRPTRSMSVKKGRCPTSIPTECNSPEKWTKKGEGSERRVREKEESEGNKR